MGNKMLNNNAITLVALVITIIVLLIIAGVAISSISGQDGIFGKAKYAADKYNSAAENEAAVINVIINNYNESNDEPKFEMTKTFGYTGNYEVFSVPKSGIYQIELWGAQGGSVSPTPGYLGGYVKGEILLNAGENLYIYVGQTGQLGKSAWNGGGLSQNASGYAQKNSGGGATDIRLVSGVWSDLNSLGSRIMVAGAGGAATSYLKSATNVLGVGGGLIGGRTADGYGRCGSGGTQTAGGAGAPGTSYGNGENGSFGKGGTGISHAWGGR